MRGKRLVLVGVLSAFFIFVCLNLPKENSLRVQYAPNDVKIFASVGAGEKRSFSAGEMELLGGLQKGSIKSIEINSSATGGTLLFGGDEVKIPAKISRTEIEKLVFSLEGESGAFFVSINSGETEAQVTVSTEPRGNKRPETSFQELETFEGIDLFSSLNIKDEDQCNIIVTEKAEGGSVSFIDGELVYSPYKSFVGKDSFSYIAQDTFGAYSKETKVVLNVEKRPDNFVYKDLIGKRGHYEALKLRKEGVLRGRSAGNTELFGAMEEMAFSDFLIALEKTMDIETDTYCVNTSLSTDSMIESFLKPYVSAALSFGIIDKSFSFPEDRCVNTALALKMINNALKLSDTRTEALKIEDAHFLKGEELQALMNLCEAGVVENKSGEIGVNENINRVSAAIYLCRALNIIKSTR